MAEINLLQNQLKDTTLVARKRTQLVVVLAALVLVVLVVIALGLYFLTQKLNTQTSGLTADNAKLQSQINNGDKELTGAKTYQAQLSNLDLLLKNHISITRLLEEMGKYTYQRAQFLTLDVDQPIRKIHMEGTVANYEGLGKLLLGLSTSPNFSNVKLISIISANSTNTNSYRFSIDMNAAPGLFVNKP
ncbi:MAG TPA: PilN domain-containing protein [Patescibacteria group bacterium]